MPRLEELYMASNMITALSGWESLPALKKLDLHNNQIEKIDDELPELPSLTHINLRRNKIRTMEVLGKLFQFPGLTDVNVERNPVDLECSSPNVILAEVLRKNAKLLRFNEVNVTDSARLEAIFLAQYRYD